MTDEVPTATAWAAYREEAFGEPYMVWHDGPDFYEFQSRFAADPELATSMLSAGLAQGDALAAETPRELTLTDEQREVFVRMLTEAMPDAEEGVRVEGGTTLFALTGDAAWSAPVAGVLASDLFWGVRIDAAMRLAAFPPTAELVATLANGVRDPEYLVRHHSASTLMRWAGVTADISEDKDLFPLLAADDAPEGWATVAERLAAAVPVEP